MNLARAGVAELADALDSKAKTTSAVSVADSINYVFLLRLRPLSMYALVSRNMLCFALFRHGLGKAGRCSA